MNNLRSGGVKILIHEEQIWLILVCGVYKPDLFFY